MEKFCEKTMNMGKCVKQNPKMLGAVLAMVMMIGCVAGGTLAWLSDSSEKVTNTFTTSNIAIEMDETERTYKMIPGWTMDKDPNVTVASGSEDCYLFVKIDEIMTPVEVDSVSYDFDDFLVYAVDSKWTQLETGVYYIKVDTDEEKNIAINILGAGSYVDENGTPSDSTDDVTYQWTADQLLTKPEVTEEMMEAVTSNNNPKLAFTAYAVQLWKTNMPGAGATDAQIAAAQFTPAEAWAKIGH